MVHRAIIGQVVHLLTEFIGREESIRGSMTTEHGRQ